MSEFIDIPGPQSTCGYNLMIGLISKVVPKMFSLFLRMLLQSLAYNDFNLRGKWHAFIKQNPQILGKALAINTHFTRKEW
jgi:hypothetical protein